MQFNIPHKFGTHAAFSRLQQGIAQAKPHLAGQATIDKEEWRGHTLNFAVTAQGKQITGTVEVTDTQYKIQAKLPLLWRLFEGKIETMLKDELAKQLGSGR